MTSSFRITLTIYFTKLCKTLRKSAKLYETLQNLAKLYKTQQNPVLESLKQFSLYLYAQILSMRQAQQRWGWKTYTEKSTLIGEAIFEAPSTLRANAKAIIFRFATVYTAMFDLSTTRTLFLASTGTLKGVRNFTMGICAWIGTREFTSTL